MNYAKNDAQIRQGDIVIANPPDVFPGGSSVQVLGTVIAHNDGQQPEDFVALVQASHILYFDQYGNRSCVANGQVFECTQLEPVFLSGLR